MSHSGSTTVSSWCGGVFPSAEGSGRRAEETAGQTAGAGEDLALTPVHPNCLLMCSSNLMLELCMQESEIQC